jgi:YD repeat-containing protein
MTALIWVWLSCALAFAEGNVTNDNFLNLSFTGDGKTPSVLSLMEAQDIQVKGGRSVAGPGDRGDAAWSLGVSLPPSPMSPNVSVTYSSAASAHSWVGRGWSIASGVRIDRIVGPSANDYKALSSPHQVSGGGLDGLLSNESGNWVWISSSPSHLDATYDSKKRRWTLKQGGVTTVLAASTEVPWKKNGLQPVAWRPVRQTDSSGNRIVWTWTGDRLDRIDYGGNSQTSDDPFLAVVFGYSNPGRASYSGARGHLEVIDQRLNSVTVRSFDEDRLRYEFTRDSTGEHVTAIHDLDVARGDKRLVASFDYTGLHLHGKESNKKPPVLAEWVTSGTQSWEPSDSLQTGGLFDQSGDGLLDAYTGGKRARWLRRDLGDTPGWRWESSKKAKKASRDVDDPVFDRSVSVKVLQQEQQATNTPRGPNHLDSRHGTYHTRRHIDVNGDGWLDVLETTVKDPEGCCTEPTTDQGIDEDDPNTDEEEKNGRESTYLWQIRFGGPVASTNEVEAPFKYPRIGTRPQLGPESTIAHGQSFVFHDGTVDLLDLNHDGWLDVVQITNDQRLRVWWKEPSRGGHWAKTAETLKTDFSPHAIQTSRGHPVMSDWDTYNANKGIQKVPVMEYMEVTAGFRDLNADGLVDYVQTDTKKWSVWFGVAGGFASERTWKAPRSYMSRAQEGSPEVRVCPAQSRDIEQEIKKKEDDVDDTKKPRGIDIQEGTDTALAAGCNDHSALQGRDAGQIAGLLDIDADGRPDFFDGESDKWYRNLGDRFASTGSDLPAWLPTVPTPAGAVKSFGATHSSQLTFTFSDATHPPAPAVSFRSERSRVLDIDRDGLPDAISLNGKVTLGGYDDKGKKRAPPGLLAKITQGSGASTRMTWASTATMDPSGIDAGKPHEMANHRMVVRKTKTEDPVTGLSGERSWEYGGGKCRWGRCWGWARVNVRDKLSRTTTEFELARDWALPVRRQIVTDHNLKHIRGGSEDWQPRFVVENDYGSHGAHKLPWLDGRTSTEFAETGANADSRSVEVELTYDSFGNVLTVDHVAGSNHPDNVSLAMTYTSSADESHWALASMATTAFDHASQSRKVVEKGSFLYDGNSKATDPLGKGLLTTQRVCAGPVGKPCSKRLDWRFGYSPRGMLQDSFAPGGEESHVTAWQWSGTAAKTTENRRGHATTVELDSLGRPKRTTGPNKVVTLSTVDAFGRSRQEKVKGVGASKAFLLSSQTYDDTAVPRWSKQLQPAYDAQGNKTAEPATYVVQDGFGGVLQSWSPSHRPDEWIVSATVMDVEGLETFSTMPHSERLPSSFPDLSTLSTKKLSWQKFDAFGTARRSFDKHSGTTNTFVDAPGQVRSVDALGYERRLQTDTQGRLVDVREGRGSNVIRSGSYLRDGRGRVAAFIDAVENTYRYSWDVSGRLRAVTRQTPSGPEEAWYAYTWAENRPNKLFEGDLSGRRLVDWDYDSLGRISKKTVVNDATGADDVFSWDWDSAWIGAIALATDPAGTVRHEYSAHAVFGQLGYGTRQVRQYNRAGAPDAEFAQAVDLRGRNVATTWPTGARVESTYHPAGQLRTQSLHWGNQQASWTHSYDRQLGLPAGWKGGVTGDQFETSVQWDFPGRIDRIEWSVPNRPSAQYWIDFGWHDNGWLHTKTLPQYPDGPFTYDYSDLGRVTRFHQQTLGTLESYSYDTLGHPTAMTLLVDPQQKVSRSWTYDPVTRFNELGTRRDAANIVDEHTWDGQGRLATWRTRSGTTMAGDYRRYDYDGNGRLGRIQHQAATGGKTWTTSLTYDGGNGRTLEVSDHAGGGAKATYRHGGWRKEEGGQTIEQVLPFARLVGGKLRYAFNEHGGQQLWSFDQKGGEKSFQLGGVYGLPHLESGGALPIDGLHGAEPDTANRVTHFGVRHTLHRDGMWMQPEPLLWLGLGREGEAEPLFFGGSYGAGRPTGLKDTSGMRADRYESVSTDFQAANPTGQSHGGAGYDFRVTSGAVGAIILAPFVMAELGASTTAIAVFELATEVGEATGLLPTASMGRGPPKGLVGGGAGAPKGAVDDVIAETLTSSQRNLTSSRTLTADEALEAGERFLGPAYREIGKPGSGVFRSADDLRQFRIDSGSISGAHPPDVPHVHLEVFKPSARKPSVNNHIPFKD